MIFVSKLSRRLESEGAASQMNSVSEGLLGFLVFAFGAPKYIYRINI